MFQQTIFRVVFYYLSIRQRQKFYMKKINSKCYHIIHQNQEYQVYDISLNKDKQLQLIQLKALSEIAFLLPQVIFGMKQKQKSVNRHSLHNLQCISIFNYCLGVHFKCPEVSNYFLRIIVIIHKCIFVCIYFESDILLIIRKNEQQK